MKTSRYLLGGLGLVGVAAVGGAERTSLFASAPDEPVRIAISSADVRAADAEARAAYGALVSMWTSEFRDNGLRFAAPRFARYRGNIRSECGIVPASNAAYCGANNTIYYDPVFLTVQAKMTGEALGLDGDMAAVGIIAHEMGHAVSAQLGRRHRSSYGVESEADCLAGAFARHAQQDGSLESGDLDEAFYAMAAAGDPELRSSGNARVDARRQAVLDARRHGTHARSVRRTSGEDFRAAATPVCLSHNGELELPHAKYANGREQRERSKKPDRRGMPRSRESRAFAAFAWSSCGQEWTRINRPTQGRA